MLKPYQEKTKNETVKGIDLRFHFPTISDNIAIQSRLSLLTRGQYTFLASSYTASQRETAQIALMVATLSICAEFVTKGEFSWDNIDDDEEGVLFLTESYTAFTKWRDSFRNRAVQADRPSEPSDGGEPVTAPGIQE